MLNKILFVAFLIVFFYGGIGMINDFNDGELSEPVSGYFTLNTLYYCCFMICPFVVFGILGSILSIDSKWLTLGAPFLLIITFLVSGFYISDKIFENDLKKNGVDVEAVVNTTEFYWLKSSKDELPYFKFTYSLKLNEKTLEFTRWKHFHKVRFTREAKPTLDYSDFPNETLYHAGDTILLRVSKDNPMHQEYR